MSVQSLSITAATSDGLELPPVAVSDVLARALVDAVRPLAGNLLRFAIPLQVLTEMQFNAAVAGVVLPTAAARMSEQFTMVGRSITKSPEELNMAVAFAPRLVAASLAETLKLQIMKKPPIAGLVIDRVDVTLRSGAVDLHVEVTAPAPDPFAGHVKVTIDTSVVPTGDYLTLVRNDVDFDSSWFLEFLATVHSWWTGITVEGMVRGSIAGQVGYANLVMSRIKAGGELPLSAGSPGNPTFHVLPEGTAVDPGFVIAGAEAGVHVSSALNHGWWCVDDPRFLPTFTMPFDPHPYHPELPKREELLPQTRPTPAGEASVHIRRSRAEIVLDPSAPARPARPDSAAALDGHGVSSTQLHDRDSALARRLGDRIRYAPDRP